MVARNYLVGERPDAILNIVDGTNLERNLYLTTQLVELGLPVVVAINMMDLVRKNGDKLDTAELARELGCQVVEISALKGVGVQNAAQAAIAAAKGGRKVPMHTFSGPVEHALAHIEEAVVHNMDDDMQRWYAIKVFERDKKVIEQLALKEETLAHVEGDIRAAEKELDDDSEAIVTNERYIYIGQVIKACYKKHNAGGLSTSDKIDRVVTNRWLGLPIFACALFLVFALSVGKSISDGGISIGTFMTDWMNDTFGEAWLQGGSRSLLEGWGVAPWLVGIVSDGILKGVGAVLGFVPQMLVLFLLLCILEDCGYMARIAFILDRLFRRFGLSGKSFIPMLVATGCGIPGIMASRTIENERDRRMTIMTTTFMPCGAKLPVIALIAGALFGGSTWIATSAYFLGILAIVVSGIMLKKTRMFAGDPAPFVMELPAYHLPSIGNVLRGTWERGWSFIKRAGTVIVLSAIVIWLLSNLGFVNGKFGMVSTLYEDETVCTEEYRASVADRMGIPEDEVEPMDDSLIARIAQPISVVFKPLGFGDWKPTVASVTGLVAKEDVVGTFGVLYAYDDNDGEDELEEAGDQIWDKVAEDFNSFSNGHGKLAAYCFLVFNLLCAPCFAAMGAIRREMNSRKWTWFAIGYECGFAYLVALAIYQIGSMLAGYGNVIGFILGLAVVALGVYMLVRKPKEA